MIRRSALSLLSALLLSACAGMGGGEFDKEAPLTLAPAAFSDLPGWEADAPRAGVAALAKSCGRVVKASADKAFFSADPRFGTMADWQAPCRALLAQMPASDEAARSFLTQWFRPWKAGAGGAGTGLFTGYYAPALNGSLTRHGPYQTPLRARPSDLVMVNLGDFRPEWKGKRIAGRVSSGSLKPYEDRAEIVAGKLPEALSAPIVWVDDPVDAFFLEIQGSGQVTLEDGTTLRVGYEAQNGHIYTAIGAELVRRGEIDKKDVSMQSIRLWLREHPEKAAEVMNLNRSYVFFRKMDGTGVPGAEGVDLTPERSLAVDHGKLPYGLPLWVDIAPPIEGHPGFRRLMVAQDTGGAIQGAVRGDVFFGAGQDAEILAGHMKSKGQAWALLPRTLSPTKGGAGAAGSGLSLSLPDVSLDWF